MPDLYKTIVRPVVTEKSNAQLSDRLEYTFEVHPDATKPQIRAAVEALFAVHVVRVRTAMQRAKLRTRGRTKGRRPRWKKAVIRLRDGDTIAMFEG
ncbi:MAG TPA: 50S ribosomal protein L23 [Gemmatimonadales bacterium]